VVLDATRRDGPNPPDRSITAGVCCLVSMRVATKKAVSPTVGRQSVRQSSVELAGRSVRHHAGRKEYLSIRLDFRSGP